jgi:hypothetical protein
VVWTKKERERREKKRDIKRERERGLVLAFTSKTIVSNNLDHRPISHPADSRQTNKV